MKQKQINQSLAMLSAALVVMSGCSRGNQTAAVLTPEKIPTTINQAFSKSADVDKQLASDYVSDFQNQNFAAAFTDLRKLMAKNGDLTPEERAAAAGAMVTTSKELRAAADGGNMDAQKVLKQYLSSR